MNIIASFQKWLVALLLAFALPAQAAVIMTDGLIETYDPSETYIPSGTLGSDIFSIGFTYTDPDYSNVIDLVMPDGMTGTTYWSLSAGIDSTGQLMGGGALLEGESDQVKMGEFLTASQSNPKTQWFSMVNYDLSSPIAFGPGTNSELISLSDPVDDGNGNGNGNGTTNPVPEPPTMLLLAGGLLAMVSLVDGNRRRKVPVSA